MVGRQGQQLQLQKKLVEGGNMIRSTVKLAFHVLFCNRRDIRESVVDHELEEFQLELLFFSYLDCQNGAECSTKLGALDEMRRNEMPHLAVSTKTRKSAARSAASALFLFPRSRNRQVQTDFPREKIKKKRYGQIHSSPHETKAAVERRGSPKMTRATPAHLVSVCLSFFSPTI